MAAASRRAGAAAVFLHSFNANKRFPLTNAGDSYMMNRGRKGCDTT